MSDAIVLVGLSGSGKSSVAAMLAGRLARPLIDLDAELAESEGAAPSELINVRGVSDDRRTLWQPGPTVAKGGR